MHPPLEPFDSGWVRRPDGAEIYWEASGSSSGKPALYLHGGPGGGLGRGGYRNVFDPDQHLIVGIDQRGCGRSTPWAIDDLDDLDENNTSALVDDIEAVREHLGIGRWLLYGVSWGSTLALTYALAHPGHVSEIVLLAVTTTSRAEVEWITEGVGAIFPEAWEPFAAVRQPDERVVDAYARLLRDPDPDVRREAADGWDRWEATHVSLDPLSDGSAVHRTTERDRRNFATLVTHYWAQDGFLTGPHRILDRADRLAGIPGVLIHGRHDVSGPAITAWRLHRAWPGSRLHIVESEGHGGPEMVESARAAIDDFAAGQ